MYHNPVLLNESMEGLNIKPNGVYVDATFGGGGHSKKILSLLNKDGRLLAIDQDEDAQRNTINDERLIMVDANFKYLKRFLRYHNLPKVDGILADLGVSSHQIDEASRGFSTRFDAQLDMRMNQQASLSAETIVNKYSEEQLANILFEYGELRNSRVLAKRIIDSRKKQRIETTQELKEILRNLVPEKYEHKTFAVIFQAIRIEVNQEMESLKEFLTQIPSILDPEGRLCVISYHSLEDRLVKRFIKDGHFNAEVNKDFFGNTSAPIKAVGKLIRPSNEEIKGNNRARSARLRVAKLAE
jgi:16S rRNA (cytosine1402-N4)-methyltransferase